MQLTGHIISVELIQDTVGIRASRTHGEVRTIFISLQAGSVVITVIDLRTSLIPSANHRSHAETVILVVV